MSDQIVDEENDRTIPIGLFNVADSYSKAATVLLKTKVISTHPGSPISFLQYHAIELFLKSFLSLNGHNVQELASRKYGHRTCCLRERAVELGLIFQDEDNEVLSLMATTDAVIRSRYMQTGFFTWPSNEALERTCKSLRRSVGEALRKHGQLVRH